MNGLGGGLGLGLACLAIQAFALPSGSGSWFQPDLVLACIAWFSLFAPLPSAVAAAAGLGALVDAASAVPMGLHLSTWTAAAFGVGLCKKWVWREDWWSQAAVCAVAAALTLAAQGTILWALAGIAGFWRLQGQALVTAWGTALFYLPLSFLLRPAAARLREPERDLVRLRGF